jgi:tyrosine-protein kinase Etk/Wzc
MQISESQRIILLARRAVRYRKRLILLGLVIGLVPVILINLLQQPIYEASTSLVFDEISTPVPSPDGDVTRDVLLSNRLEELSSLAFAHDIAVALPPAVRGSYPLPETISGGDTLGAIAWSLHEAIVPAPVRTSNVIRISVQLPDPVLAANVANTAAQVFRDRNDRIKREGVGGVRRFIEQQMEHARDVLDSSEVALRNYKETNRITSFDGEANELLRRTTEAEVLHNQARANRGAAEERLASIQQTLRQQKLDFVPTVTGSSSPAVARLRDRLVELQSQAVELKVQGYPATHPKLVQLDQAIEETKRSLTDEATKLAAGAGIADPIAELQRYTSDATQLQIEIESSKAQEAALQKVIDNYDSSLGQLPEKEFRLVRLTRERDVNHKIYTMLLEKLEEARISEAGKIPAMRILDTAFPPPDPIRPRQKLNLLLGILVGSLLGGGVAFAVEALKGGVDSEEELEKLTGWSVLASIPRMEHPPDASGAATAAGIPHSKSQEKRHARALISQLQPESGAAEAFRILRTRLLFRGSGRECRSILVTSVGPGDGKSTSVANLAIAMAGSGQHVVLVDTEVRRPVQHELFGVARSPGMTDVLRAIAAAPASPVRQSAVPAPHPHNASWREATEDDGGAAVAEPAERFNGMDAATRHTQIAGLDLIPTGERVDNAEDRLVLALPALRELIGRLTTTHDVVLLDAPPLLLVHDAALLAGLVDGVIFVVSSERADAELLGRAKKLLTDAKANVLGVVLNHVDPERVYGYGKYYSQH